MNEVSEFHTASETYLEKLIPKMELQENEKPALPSNVLSMTDLKRMNLTDQVLYKKKRRLNQSPKCTLFYSVLVCVN